ncbi:zinc-finger domain-containing protein [Rhodovulum adriaticum]|uniref:Putative Zn-finger protein n=1 Tax=Rhodovulum adriaticum TaxID=35804 RepID=A0A4R2NKS7_RHOAD|nr:zinc-finger domain-containing protein [Rhodovulum adriaticum]MBK1635519.1 zinc-finger domain-containing protein [Rhodovulum adriaticum]TCP22091.1 putative Zn-finger protein [Rhodovulum adriaticum]
MAAETDQDPDTIAPPETEIVSAWRVACDGPGPGLGHPRVWLTIPRDTGFVECGYCDKRFVHESCADKVK